MPLMLISTLGNLEPLLESLRHHRPDSIVLIPSKDSQSKVDELMEKAGQISEELARVEKYRFPVVVSDAADLERCVEEMEPIIDEIRQWHHRGPDYKVLVDITGGTKAMSVAAALVALMQPNVGFHYVYYPKSNPVADAMPMKGIAMQIEYRTLPNPWESLGIRASYEAMILFDRGDYSAACIVLDTSLRSMNEGRSSTRKNQLVSLRFLCQAYSEWDAFRHAAALKYLKMAIDRPADFKAMLGNRQWARLRHTIEFHMAWLERLVREPEGIDRVYDLLANARRRADADRIDDAMARLYRSIEALAQVRLKSVYSIRSDAVQPCQVPEMLRTKWFELEQNIPKKIALQEAYDLLSAYGDELGLRFERLFRVSGQGRGKLAARNESILAHGFRSI
jgi:CRISPR-associated protein (TIGR02710 family)